MEWYWIVGIVLGSYVFWCLIQTGVYFYANSKDEEFTDKFIEIFFVTLVLGVLFILMGGTLYLQTSREKGWYSKKWSECKRREIMKTELKDENQQEAPNENK